MKREIFMAALAVGVFGGVAAAQSSANQVDPTAAPGPTAAGAQAKADPGNRRGTAFSLGGSYTFGADFEDNRGSVSIWRMGYDVGARFPTSENFAITLGASTEWSWYDFDPSSTGVTQGIGKPAGQVATSRIAPGFTYRIDDKWSILGGFSLESTGETDADFGDTLNYGVVFAASYKVSDTFSWTFGAAVQTTLEDGVTGLPLIGFEWKFRPQWSVGVRGPGAHLTYSPNEEVDLTLQASYESREFRLSDDNPIRDGVLQDRRVVVGLQAQWTPRKWVTLRGEAGVVAWSELEFDNSNGDSLDTLTIDPTGFLGASVTFRF